MTDQAEQDSSQAAYEAHHQLMRQQEIDKAIRECEKALQAFWQARDEAKYGNLWGNQ